jgi:REP element-mobilizing transposase RayT
MGHTYTHHLYHIVFSTRDRVAYLRAEDLAELRRYFAIVAGSLGASLLACGGVADHVHLLGRLSPSMAVSDFVGKLKANSSRVLKERGLHDFAWQAGYASFTVSESVAGDVTANVERQEAHHRQVSFAVELRAFLDKHRVDYDPDRILD